MFYTISIVFFWSDIWLYTIMGWIKKFVKNRRSIIL